MVFYDRNESILMFCLHHNLSRLTFNYSSIICGSNNFALVIVYIWYLAIGHQKRKRSVPDLVPETESVGHGLERGVTEGHGHGIETGRRGTRKGREKRKDCHQSKIKHLVVSFIDCHF